MKTSSIRLIILLSALSLVGLIITQSFWVVKAVHVSQEHFDHRVYTALKSAVEEITGLEDTAKLSKNKKYKSVFSVLKPCVFDSLLKKYFDFYKLDTCFEFAVVKSKTSEIVYSTPEFPKDVRQDQLFKNCLSSLCANEHHHLEVFFPAKTRFILLDVWGWLLISVVFIVIVIICFSFIVFAVFHQKKLSEMKTDFVNNLIHEFKTPISTISLASEVMLSCDSNSDSERIKKYGTIIYDENKRMRLHVDQVLRMSRLDRNGFDLNKEEIDVHELIKTTVQNLCLQKNYQKVSLSFSFMADRPNLWVDPLHLTNIINNLVENAIKYSNGFSEIEIVSENIPKGIIISVKDNGIGMREDQLKLIFDKFYRIPTGDVHNAKGFGLGLFYVKEMVKAHGGKISVISEPGRGSKFEVFLPFG